MKAAVPMAVLAAMLSGCAVPREPLFPRHPPVARQRVEVGQWKLRVRRDRFSGEITCRLYARNHKAYFASGAVAFRFSPDWNTSGAVYRVDGGVSRKWREDVPELVRMGAPFDRGGIDNPGKGLVWIPFTRLKDAGSIAIEARPDRAPVTFRFKGLSPLYATALDRGCVPDSRFVR